MANKKKRPVSAAFPDLAARVEQALMERAQPAQYEQVGSSRFTKRTGGGTAYDKVEGTNSLTNEFFGSGEADLDVILEQASKKSPEFAKRRAEKRGKEALAGVMSDYGDMVSERKGAEASEAGKRTATKAKSAGADLDDMAEMGRYRGKDKGGVTSGTAPTASASSAAPTRTRETLPSVDGPMRSISSGDKSIFDTMSKAEMGRDRAIGELSSDSAAMRSSAAASPARDIDALFKKATGTTFNPKSRADRAALAEIQSVMSSRPELADASDTKVALAWYNSKRK